MIVYRNETLTVIDTKIKRRSCRAYERQTEDELEETIFPALLTLPLNVTERSGACFSHSAPNCTAQHGTVQYIIVQ